MKKKSLFCFVYAYLGIYSTAVLNWLCKLLSFFAAHYIYIQLVSCFMRQSAYGHS